jgi:multiple sugar transport system substrate-binding protein
MNSAEQIEARLAGTAQVTARDDVNAAVLANDPMLTYVAEDILPITHYRPSFAEYPQVSVALQEAVESVVTGTSAEDAAADYQAALEGIVGADAVNGG